MITIMYKTEKVWKEICLCASEVVDFIEKIFTGSFRVFLDESEEAVELAFELWKLAEFGVDIEIGGVL